MIYSLAEISRKIRDFGPIITHNNMIYPFLDRIAKKYISVTCCYKNGKNLTIRVNLGSIMVLEDLNHVQRLLFEITFGIVMKLPIF